MKMKKILALLLCALLIVSVFTACGAKADGKSGEVKMVVVDIAGETVIDAAFQHEDGKNIADEIQANFKVVEASPNYFTGIFLKADESVGISAEYANGSWLALYVDDEMSMVGIGEVTYHDGIVIKWVETPAA